MFIGQRNLRKALSKSKGTKGLEKSVISHFILEQPVFVTPSKIKRDNAFSAVEAPRGTLIHYYKVNEDMVVADARIHVPTELKSFSIHEILNRTCKEEFTNNKSLESVRETAKFIVRSFDPCISCTSVNHDKTNRL